MEKFVKQQKLNFVSKDERDHYSTLVWNIRYKTKSDATTVILKALENYWGKLNGK